MLQPTVVLWLLGRADGVLGLIPNSVRLRIGIRGSRIALARSVGQALPLRPYWQENSSRRRSTFTTAAALPNPPGSEQLRKV